MKWWVKDSAVIPRGLAWTKNVDKKFRKADQKKVFGPVSNKCFNEVNFISIVI